MINNDPLAEISIDIHLLPFTYLQIEPGKQPQSERDMYSKVTLSPNGYFQFLITVIAEPGGLAQRSGKLFEIAMKYTHLHLGLF